MATITTSTGTADLPAEIFGVQTNVPLIHQVVVAQLAAARQGTHSTKNRGEVRGGGAKPYRQKGTGRARQGSTRAPQFTGGGVVHGPTPRDYSQRTPKKMKAAALRGALSDRARHDRVHVVDSLVTGNAPSAKQAYAALVEVTLRPNVLVVLERSDEVAWKSVRNLQDVHVLAADQLNTYDVLCSDDVVFTRGAFDAFVAASRTTTKTTTETAETAETADTADTADTVGTADPSTTAATPADDASEDEK
jgi:large subunit ribosomal protein L4